METSSPVRGLRPMPVLRGRTLKTPKPRSSMRWPFSRARFMASKTVSTASSALDLLMPVRVTTSLTMSSLIKSVLAEERPFGRAPPPPWARGPRGAGGPIPEWRRSDDAHQVRPLDPPDGPGAAHDRALRGGAETRRRDQLRAVELRLRRPGGGRIQDLHQRLHGAGGPEAFRPALLRRVQGRGAGDSAELVRAGAVGGVLPHPAECFDDLHGEVDLRALRHHRQRHPLRAGVGGF